MCQASSVERRYPKSVWIGDLRVDGIQKLDESAVPGECSSDETVGRNISIEWRLRILVLNFIQQIPNYLLGVGVCSVEPEPFPSRPRYHCFFEKKRIADVRVPAEAFQGDVGPILDKGLHLRQMLKSQRQNNSWAHQSLKVP